MRGARPWTGVAVLSIGALLLVPRVGFPGNGDAAVRSTGPALAAELRSAGRPVRPPTRGGLVRLTPRAWAWVARHERSSNGALFVGDTAALVVDPGLTPGTAREFLAAVHAVTAIPVRYVVLTHWHPDHALGVACLTPRPFRVLAHPLNRRRFAEGGARALASLRAAATEEKERSELAACRLVLPDETVAQRRFIDLGGYTVEVRHLGPAHTEGDLVVWSPADAVLAAGDIFMRDASPSMGEGSITGWIAALDTLLALAPRHAIPGHFAPGSAKDLRRFREYLNAQLTGVETELAAGVPPDSVPVRLRFPEFADFGQYPQYDATFSGNARAVVREVLARPARPGDRGGFAILATLKVGQNPHQIAFSADGKTAWIAAAGSDAVARVDVASLKVTGLISVPGTPLGVAPLPDGSRDGVARLAVALFGSDGIVRLSFPGALSESSAERLPPVVSLHTGGAPSLLVGPLPENRYLIASEKTDRVWLLNAAAFRLERAYEVGRRPFPPAATSDGRLAFVPGYDDGSVTVIDLWNGRVLDTVDVGEHPSGGTVLPGDVDYAVAVRGEHRIRFINTASHRVVGELSGGIGRSPFSVVAAPNGRLAFVNNTEDADVSVIALPERRVVARVPVGKIPIVMAVHPSGRTLWVSSEGSHTLSVIRIPARWRMAAPMDAASGAVTEVAVLGMIHGAHRGSRRWGLEQVRETIRRIAPDAVCAEIPPDRWERIWSDYTERGVIEDPRILRFPEYTDVLLPLAIEMGFEIIPCAGWTQEMSDLRNARIRAFESDSARSGDRAAYHAALARLRAKYPGEIDEIDDPRVIHSKAYDERMREELGPYDRYLNDWIGPGGWTNINRAHLRLIDRAIRSHRGQRLLVTFGSGHKYWILEKLRARSDVQLLEVAPFLPAATGG